MSTKFLHKRARYTVATVAISAAAVSGLGVAVAAGGGSGQPSSPPPGVTNGHTGDPVSYGKATNTAGRHLDVADAVHDVLQGIGDGTLVRNLTADTRSAGTTVSVELAHNGDDVPEVWASDLVVGALGELMRTDQATMNDVIVSASAAGPGADGTSVTTSLGVGAVRLGQVFNSPNDSTLSDHVNEAARTLGLTVSSLKILHPLESAIEVTLVVPDDAKVDWTIDQLRTALVGSSPMVEGVLIELDSTDGQPLLRSGVAYRTGEGGLWFAPGQDARFGAGHGGLAGGS